MNVTKLTAQMSPMPISDKLYVEHPRRQLCISSCKRLGTRSVVMYTPQEVELGKIERKVFKAPRR